MDLVKGGKVTSTSPLLMGEKLFDLFTQFIWAFRLLVLPVVRTGRLPVLIHFVSSDLAHRLSTSGTIHKGRPHRERGEGGSPKADIVREVA